jgi:hypothetical protein
MVTFHCTGAFPHHVFDDGKKTQLFFSKRKVLPLQKLMKKISAVDHRKECSGKLIVTGREMLLLLEK